MLPEASNLVQDSYRTPKAQSRAFWRLRFASSGHHPPPLRAAAIGARGSRHPQLRTRRASAHAAGTIRHCSKKRPRWAASSFWQNDLPINPLTSRWAWKGHRPTLLVTAISPSSHATTVHVAHYGRDAHESRLFVAQTESPERAYPDLRCCGLAGSCRGGPPVGYT